MTDEIAKPGTREKNRVVLLTAYGLAAGAILGTSIGRFSGLQPYGALAGLLCGGILGFRADQNKSVKYIAAIFCGAISVCAITEVPMSSPSSNLLPGAMWGLGFAFLPRSMRFPLFTVLISVSGLCAIPDTDNTDGILRSLFLGPAILAPVVIAGAGGYLLHLCLSACDRRASVGDHDQQGRSATS